MQSKSSVEKDKLSTLKLECSETRTEDERKCKGFLKLVLTNASQQKLKFARLWEFCLVVK